MQKHTQTVLTALAGFALTSMVMLPPALSARAEKAARIAVFEQELGPNTTVFGSDRAGRLASLLRSKDYRDDAQQQMAEAGGARLQTIR